MSVDYIQLVGTDVPGSCGSCCLGGQVQHEALRCPSEPVAPEDISSPLRAIAGGDGGQLLLFNCPEGTQRFSSEGNLRLVRVRGFFFTRWAVSSVMGMPGLMFTINDAGARHANFFGPSSHCGHTAADARCSLPDAAEMNAAGLEGMLDAMRRHYFAHRPMSFQQLRSGTVLRRLATPLSGNYVCEVPLPLLEDEKEEVEKKEEEEGAAKREHRRDMSPLSSRLSSSFFVLALMLSPTSALLGFRVSRSADPSSCEQIYGYAILHAPTASFDPQRARALGVPPGPMYAQLKQGTGVWIGDGKNSAGDEAAGESRRFIDPRSVKRATVGSRSLYVSLVLDGDSCGDVAAAMESLFGCDVAAASEGHGQGERSSTIALGERNGRYRGKLREFLAQWQPSLLRCDDYHAASDASAETAQTERRVVLVHMVHVQPSQFFSEFMMTDISATHAHYVRSIFARVRSEIREQAVRCFRHVSNGEEDDTTATTAVGATAGVTHHFCAAVQQNFSAFPTALAHRYHLNYIAAAQFPMTLLSAGEASQEGNEEEEGAGRGCGLVVDDGKGGEEKSGPVWPYSVKHRLVPADAVSPILDAAQNSASSLPLSSPPKKTLKKGGKSSNVQDQDTLGLLRYPTARSAVAMLSPEFRSTVAAVCQHIPSSMCIHSSSSQHSHYHHQRDTDKSQVGSVDGGGALTFLGTGSAVPSKYRNVSGTFLEVMYNANPSGVLRRAIIVLDFGEGNAGQLATFWGDRCDQAMREFFEDLAFVFISHAHADHHLGLLSLLELRHRLRQHTGLAPLLVVCPQEVHEFLQETWGRCAAYRRWLQEEVVFDVMPAERYRDDDFFAAPVFLPRLDALCRHLNDHTSVGATGTATTTGNDGVLPMVWGAEVFPVHHPANAHALLLRFPTPTGTDVMSRVFLFSGDTRPSLFLIKRCRQFTERGPDEQPGATGGVFLCLHEATFGEGCEEEAVQKCHSTLPEALRVAAAIRAEHVVLVHFSQRYPKLPGLMKSQLDGKDVDLHCRRRRPLAREERGDVREQSDGMSGVADSRGGMIRTEGAREQESTSSLLSSPQQSPDAAGLDSPVEAAARKMCFGFDFMRLSFASLESQQTAQLTPLFVQLLEEYESWGVGTTKRLRE